MKIHPIIALLCLAARCLAQETTPGGIPAPFAGFGNTSLDQRPKGARIATPPPYVSSIPPNGASTANQANSASPTSLSFDAKTVANGGGISGNAVGNRGASTTATRVSHPVIQLTVRNLSAKAEGAHFDWFFVASDLNGRGRYVWDQGQRDLNLAGSATQSEMLESAPVAQQTTNQTRATNYVYTDGSGGFTSYSSTQTRTGSRADGWIVRMSVGGAIVRVQASTAEFEQIGRDPAKLDLLMKRKPQATPAPFGMPPLR